MKKILAIIKLFKVDEVKDALTKIFIQPIEDVIRIKTRETGVEAL